ncbi:hypothetical protein ACLOJK_020419 [Asimina triloba]
MMMVSRRVVAVGGMDIDGEVELPHGGLSGGGIHKVGGVRDDVRGLGATKLGRECMGAVLEVMGSYRQT